MSSVHLSSCICCCHEYQGVWGRIRLLEGNDNINDPHTVSVMKGKEVVGHVPRKIPGCVPFLEQAVILSVL